MAQSNHRPTPGGAGSERDWSDILSGGALNLLETIPYIGRLVSAFRRDPSEENLARIASAMEGLIQGVDQLDGMRGLLEEAVSNQNILLEGLKDMMATYQRPDLFGQLSAYSILGEAVRQIKRLADQAEHMAGSLKGIDENIRSVNIRGDYFPAHVHSYARMMIKNCASAVVPHYFTVFNKSSQWHPKFADLQRSDPLGSSYLGQKTDLDELCAFLVEEVRPRVGPEAVLHILMPTIGQLSLEEAVKLPNGMYPCCIHGQLGDAGTPFVFICMPDTRDRECLRDIGVLKPREVWAMTAGIGIPFIAGFTTKTQFIDPTYKICTDVDLIFAGGAFHYCGPEPPRTLGERVTRPWSSRQWISSRRSVFS